jgi:hypothetical protein
MAEIEWQTWSDIPKVATVPEAVEAHLTPESDYGSLEGLEYGTEKTREYLGALTDMLVEKGVLTAEDLGKLLGLSEVKMRPKDR